MFKRQNWRVLRGRLKQDALDEEYINMIEQTVRNISNAKLLLNKLKELHASDTMEAQGRLNRRYHDFKFDRLKGPVVFFNDLMRIRYQMTLSGSQVISETQLCLDFLAKLPQGESKLQLVRQRAVLMCYVIFVKSIPNGMLSHSVRRMKRLLSLLPCQSPVKKRKRNTDKSGLDDKAKKRKCVNCGISGHPVERCFFDGGGAEKDRPKWWLDQHKNGTAPLKFHQQEQT
ncbi:hypothetical protein MP228_003594 [Amoeboaphelidium protococcarum]|nr:hypothetical protein MP228_003594 [Amoeboaphelidium protococcarum]